VLGMQLNKTCPLVEQYLGYLVVIKGRSENTILEYRTDLLMFFNFVLDSRNIFINNSNFSIVDLNFIKSITLNDMYDFITHCQTKRRSSAGTRARKIVSIRQF
jgi:site-specific recombinase XerD